MFPAGDSATAHQSMLLRDTFGRPSLIYCRCDPRSTCVAGESPIQQSLQGTSLPQDWARGSVGRVDGWHPQRPFPHVEGDLRQGIRLAGRSDAFGPTDRRKWKRKAPKVLQFEDSVIFVKGTHGSPASGKREQGSAWRCGAPGLPPRSIARNWFFCALPDGCGGALLIPPPGS